MAKRIVVALGGNALGNTPEEQLDLVRHTAKTIVDLSEAGYEVIVGHGNGPQVGMINLAMEFSSTKGGNTPYMPFPECGAMSQGAAISDAPTTRTTAKIWVASVIVPNR